MLIDLGVLPVRRWRCDRPLLAVVGRRPSADHTRSAMDQGDHELLPKAYGPRCNLLELSYPPHPRGRDIEPSPESPTLCLARGRPRDYDRRRARLIPRRSQPSSTRSTSRR